MEEVDDALPGTIDAPEAATRSWDLIVVGAGPAGAVAAASAARAGLDTLILERQRFPRQKVCGGCLNHAAVVALERAGLGDRLDECGGQRVDRLTLVHRGVESTIAAPGGLAITRRTLDRMLASAAIDSGAHFLPETSALILPDPPGVLPDRRRIELRAHGSPTRTVETRMLVVADGLGHPSLRMCSEFESLVEDRSRIGIGAVTDAGLLDVEPGEILMAIGEWGYAGAVLAEGGRLIIAAAIDPESIRERGSVGRSVAAVFEEARLDSPPELRELAWQGTLPLTQRSKKLTGWRLVVIGDAAGYVEPFTGEGMAWALAEAAAVLPFIRIGVDGWCAELDGAWRSTYRALVGRQQRACRWLSEALRSPALVRAGLGLTRRWPVLARPIVARLGA